MLPAETNLVLCSVSAMLLFCGLIWFPPSIKKRILSYSGLDPDLMTPAETFSHIYEHNKWGNPLPNTPFYSGDGSHIPQIVEPYVLATRSFIKNSFSRPPDVVDLGCGDFNVGKQILEVTNRYIACDIVTDVIDYNRLAFADEDVDFRVLDMISEEPPAGDIVFIRQVLQHFRNDQISRLLPKLHNYKWAVITESIPFHDPFMPNLDISATKVLTGTIRTDFDSGIDLIQAPFNLVHYDSVVLCEAVERTGRVRTTAYRLRKTQEEP